jgi:hypothetical protein
MIAVVSDMARLLGRHQCWFMTPGLRIVGLADENPTRLNAD